MALNSFIWAGVQGAVCGGEGLVQREGRGGWSIVALQGNTCSLDSGCTAAAFFFNNKNEGFLPAFRDGKYLGSSALGTFLSEHRL